MENIIATTLRQNKPDIASSTLKTYTSMLNSVWDKTHPKSKAITIEEFNTDLIIETIDKYDSLKSQSVIYSALFALTKNIKFDNKIKELRKILNNLDKTDKKTDKQEDNWVDKATIQDAYNNLKLQADNSYKLLKLTNDMDMRELQKIQLHLLICLNGGLFIPPRRNQDWFEMKLTNINKATDNYIEKDMFVFNKYKTQKSYGEQRVTIPKELKSILTKWIKLLTKSKNNYEYLLFDSNSSQLNSIQMVQRFNKIFGTNTSTNILRHSFISDEFVDSIEINKKSKSIAKQMGTSAELLQHLYLKDNAKVN